MLGAYTEVKLWRGAARPKIKYDGKLKDWGKMLAFETRMKLEA